MPNNLDKPTLFNYNVCMKLKNITAIITGSTGHLGGAIAMALAQQRCNCICQYNTNKHLADKLVDCLETLGVKAIAVKADLTRPEDINRLFFLSPDFHVPRVLINSAAIFPRRPLSDVMVENVRQTLDVNLTAPILISAIFAERIRKRYAELFDVEPDTAPLAKIVNLTDVAAAHPWPNYTAYCASKAGLAAATVSMAKELAPLITVNAVAPGIINQPPHFTEEQKKRQIDRIPAKRPAKPSEIASAILFLLENDYITGQTITVDGGRYL
ncbi:MAG: SDR family oxidoreductase [Anaerohalosphaera sp.]|nr:SDR family oxidoreductase [Anaerohalosphaera sp.]